jgi:hypothetical protein
VIHICILRYYVYLVGKEEAIDCKNAQSGKLQDNTALGGKYEPKRDEAKETGDNCTRRSFLICTQQILLQRPNHEG